MQMFAAYTNIVLVYSVTKHHIVLTVTGHLKAYTWTSFVCINECNSFYANLCDKIYHESNTLLLLS